MRSLYRMPRPSRRVETNGRRPRRCAGCGRVVAAPNGSLGKTKRTPLPPSPCPWRAYCGADQSRLSLPPLSPCQKAGVHQGRPKRPGCGGGCEDGVVPLGRACTIAVHVEASPRWVHRDRGRARTRQASAEEVRGDARPFNFETVPSLGCLLQPAPPATTVGSFGVACFL